MNEGLLSGNLYLSRLAQLGQAEIEAKVEKKFLAGSNPARRITKKSYAAMAKSGNRAFLEESETVKLRLFQEVEKHGLNSSQIVGTNLSQLRVQVSSRAP